MVRVNSFINKYFGVILLCSAVAGLFFRFETIDSSVVIIISLATVIFSSFFRINLSSELYKSDWKTIFIFYGIRFLLFPVLVYFLALPMSNFYAIGFFLLLMLPSAVSSPAFSAMYEGDISLALKVLLFTSFASILLIPLLSSLILTKSVAIDTRYMFLILIYTIVVPFLAHIPFRRSKTITNFFVSNNALVTALGLMTIFVFSTSKNREIILNNPGKVMIYAAIAFVFFALAYFIGYFAIPGLGKLKRIALSVCSGANNIGMGVTLTMLFFPGETNVFFIIAQLSWIFVLIPMRYFYRII